VKKLRRVWTYGGHRSSCREDSPNDGTGVCSSEEVGDEGRKHDYPAAVRKAEGYRRRIKQPKSVTESHANERCCF
jgi:hypothetical protein